MKRKANYNVRHKPGGGAYKNNIPDKKPNPRLRWFWSVPSSTKPIQKRDGWAARLVNDPLELLCFAAFCVVICWVITLFR